mmetsp:Transcript_600/g.1034  ORF Transcript_600/g.1034 Transcript_600/m.1034 type:complete len:683 (+) Transcript_600:113-2161(+)|eukprot:CAMPEP_0197521226 /NCGR_PEP_ID=MMETSP1318-20131121/6498_1 /TAXON_ID=552666 /ORGANISM="Partenskyella glossopodia, Strain RCC365" /LENGTH=682 /DNA_ID=CAMNT_0043073115 /DNA_START=73 /DNA_END=2121 /DNA_ORIENTATION=-
MSRSPRRERKRGAEKSVEGKLRIEVFSGRKLTDKAVIGTQSPYLVLKIGGKRLVTKVCKRGGIEPKWDQGFDIELSKSMEQTLKIEVWSKETFSDVMIGKREVNCYAFWKKTPGKGGWWRIISKSYAHKVRGEIFFRVFLNGKTYKQTHMRKPSLSPVGRTVQKPVEPGIKMIFQVILPAGVTVRTQPSLDAPKVSYDAKIPVVLEMGSLVDSEVIHKSYSRGPTTGGKYVTTYWARGPLGWSCIKYGHTMLMAPLSEHKLYEVIDKEGASCRMAPGLGAHRTGRVLPHGTVLIGKQVMPVEESKGEKSQWILHSWGWTCASLGSRNVCAQIMFRKVFQVILKDGVSIREKPSLEAPSLGVLKHMQCAVARDLKASKERNGMHSIWVRTLQGWSCLKLDKMTTMIPLGAGQAWWEVTAQALSIRKTPGTKGEKTPDVLKKGDTLVSKGLFQLPYEKAFWLKLRGGYSCAKMGGQSHMRLKAGVEMWQVTNQAGLYIRDKPGAKKHILGFLREGDLFLSRGVVEVNSDEGVPLSRWARHGQGWTCIQFGNQFVAKPVIPDKVKQTPHRTYNRQSLFAPGAPAVVQVPYASEGDQKLAQAVAANPNGVQSNHHRTETDVYGAPPAYHDVPHAEGVAVVVGEPVVVHPTPAPAPAVVTAVAVPPSSDVTAQVVTGVTIVGTAGVH